MSKTLAIITARGGSKRIPGKNIKDFLGKPIIIYSIEAALEAGCFDEIMVSTDDPGIADVARAAGASIPFIRSVENSGDFATTADAVAEVLTNYGNLGKTFTYACCLYPTAPFVTGEKLKKAYKLIQQPSVKSVVPVVRFGFPILRSFKIEDGLVKMNWPQYANIRSQDIPPSYHDCGQFYFLNVEAFLKERKLFTDHTIPMEMSELEVQDIDNPVDWEIAELKYTLLQKGNLS